MNDADEQLDAHIHRLEVRVSELEAVLHAVWHQCEDLVTFEPLRDAVKRALRLREFEGKLDG